METETNNTQPLKLTATQLVLLARIGENPRSTSRDMNHQTLNALASRRLVKMVDRFPNGTSLWSITGRGVMALRIADSDR